MKDFKKKYVELEKKPSWGLQTKRKSFSRASSLRVTITILIINILIWNYLFLDTWYLKSFCLFLASLYKYHIQAFFEDF